MTRSTQPLAVVVAGPNGAGKSTSASRLLRGAFAVHEFVNADVIAAGISVFRPEVAAFAAGRAFLARVKQLAAARADFAFETTLASRSFAPFLRDLRATGYRTHLAFLSLPSADLAVARVAERVRDGGHDVPEATVRRRFRAGLANLIEVYPAVLDSWQVFDNAGPSPRPIARAAGGSGAVVLDADAWDHLRSMNTP